MLSYNELKPGIFIVLDNQPFQVIKSEFLRMQQRQPVMKARLKNLLSGKVSEHSFQPSDEIEEAKIEKTDAKFIFESRDVWWFCELNNPKNRFSFKKEELNEQIIDFLKPDLEVKILKFNNKIIAVELPVKADYRIIEAPPTIRGDTAQGGSKIAVIETGAKVSVPLFINEGDIVRINTATSEYVERVEKIK